jgi:hypothetical protein
MARSFRWPRAAGSAEIARIERWPAPGDASGLSRRMARVGGPCGSTTRICTCKMESFRSRGDRVNDPPDRPTGSS